MSDSYLDKTGLAHFWAKIKAHVLQNGIFYGTCATAAGTAAKVATVDGVTELKTGLTIAVKFTYANGKANPTLNVNSLGAVAIYRYGTTVPSTSAASSWNAGSVVTLTYDGSHWQMHDWNNTTYTALSEADMKTGTATAARLITAQRLKQAVEYHAPVTSVNGSTGAVTVTVPTAANQISVSGYSDWATTQDAIDGLVDVAGELEENMPTKTSDLTNDSGFITSAPVTSVNGQTGAVTISVPTATSQLTNDGDGTGTNYYVKSTELALELAYYIDEDKLATPAFYACDSTSQAVMAQLGGRTPQIQVPSDFISLAYLIFMGLEPRRWFAWMNGTEMELAKLQVSVNTSNSAITLYLRGRTSIATGIMGVDSSWTVTPMSSSVAEIVRW